MNKCGIAFYLILLSAGVALGDPLVRFPSGNASWTVDLTYRADKQEQSTQGPLRCAKVAAQRTGTLRKDTVLWSDGNQTETWWISNPSLVCYEDARIKEIVVSPVNDLFNGLRFDESLFEWISAEKLIGEERRNGKTCLLYEGIAFSNASGEGIKTRAWIDKESLLPVASENSECLVTFSFQEPPQTLLTVPSKCEELVSRYRRASAAATPQKKDRVRR